jgi:MoaA/NifB/PqqE/SkfB family radical SAM enzyme
MPLNWSQVSRQLAINARALRQPISATFELTSRCNLRCKMCYVSVPADRRDIKERELTAGQWISLAEQARNAGVLFLLLTGGEVFLRKDFKEIYEAVASMGFITQIYTNGTLITPEIARWLGKMPPLQVSITIYGSSRDTYERVCGVGSGYDNVINGIRLLRQEGINVELKTTAVKGNWKEFDEIGAIAREYEAIYGVVNYIAPRRSGCGSDPLGERLSPEETVEHDAIRVAYNKKYRKRPSQIANDEYDSSLVKKIEEPKREENDAFQCQVGKSGFWITWDGRMTPCGMLEEPCEYPLEQGIIHSFENIKDGCRKIPVCMECEKCSYKDECISCPARLKLETGAFDKPASYLCELAKLRKLEKSRK